MYFRKDNLFLIIGIVFVGLLMACSKRSLSGRAEQMKSLLFQVEAADKSCLSLLPYDSLLDEAICYYGKGLYRAKALLYKGRILASMKMDENAMKCCFDALKMLGEDEGNAMKIKGMLYEDLGNLYLKQSLLDKAVESFGKAKDCFLSCGYMPGISSANSNIGWCFLCGEDTMNARNYMRQGIFSPCDVQDSIAMSVLMHNLSCTFEDMDSVLFYARQALAYDTKNSMKPAIMVGYVYLNDEQEDSAEYYFQQALKDRALETRALAYNGLKDLMEIKGEYEQALEFYDSYSALMDSIYFFRESSEVERKSYEYVAESKFYKEKIRVRAWSVGICMVILFLATCIVLRVLYWRRIRRLQYERDEATLQTDISQLQYHMLILRRQHERDRELLSEKTRELQNLADEQAKWRNVAFKETPIYKKIEALSSQKKGKKESDVRILLSEEQTQLRATIREIYKDYIIHLKNSYPQYTEDDCMFACLSLLGLDDFTLALCFGNFDTRIVVQRRYRMKKKAENGLKE